MSKAPWYKRYPGDFVSNPYVQAMSAEQYGWFSAALDAAWLHSPQGYLPNDWQLLSRMIGRCDEMYFRTHAQIVLDRFQITEDGKWIYHPKMLEQVEKLSEVSEKRRETGKKGASKRWKQADSNCHFSGKQLPTDSDSDSDSELDSDIENPSPVFLIVVLYPTLSHLKNDSEIPYAVVGAVVKAIEKDGVDAVKRGTIAYAKSLTDRKFAMNPYKFYDEFHYRRNWTSDAEPESKFDKFISSLDETPIEQLDGERSRRGAGKVTRISEAL